MGPDGKTCTAWWSERRPELVQMHNCAALMAGVFVVVVTFSVCCVMAVVVRRWALLVLNMLHLQAAAATQLLRAESTPARSWCRSW